MKKIIIVLSMLPSLSFAQCTEIIGAKPEDAMLLIPEIQENLGFELRRSGNPFSRKRIVYVDSLEVCEVEIFSNSEDKYDGLSKIPGEPTVNELYITGPTDRIIKLFEYFKNKYKSCNGYSAEQQYMLLPNTLISYGTFNGSSQYDIPLSTMKILKDKHK